MDKVFEILERIKTINDDIKYVTEQLEKLQALQKEVVAQYLKEVPYYKIEWVADDNGEYTYCSHTDYRWSLQKYVDLAKARAHRTKIPAIRAYIWEDIPYEDKDKELIGLYEPKLVLTL